MKKIKYWLVKEDERMISIHKNVIKNTKSSEYIINCAVDELFELLYLLKDDGEDDD